ncbi:MAG: flagellar protein FlaG [Bacillaceae bacterium]|nr:flagellar protein FlaG [Bacillaceae bacterium]
MEVRSVLSKSQLLHRAENISATSPKSGEQSFRNVAEQGEKRDKQASEEPISKEQVKEIVNGLNEFLEPSKTSIQYKLHEDLKDYYVAIVDTQTKEVIKEIPPKKLLDMYAAMAEFMGLIVDKKI